MFWRAWEWSYSPSIQFGELIQLTSPDTFLKDVAQWELLVDLPLTAVLPLLQISRQHSSPTAAPASLCFPNLQEVEVQLFGRRSKFRLIRVPDLEQNVLLQNAAATMPCLEIDTGWQLIISERNALVLGATGLGKYFWRSGSAVIFWKLLANIIIPMDTMTNLLTPAAHARAG